MTDQVKKLSIEDFTKSTNSYLSAVTRFENTSNIAGKNVRIAHSQGNLETFLNPITAKLDGSKYPEKVNALRSLLMDNTDKKVTLGRLEGKGYAVTAPTQTRQRAIKVESLLKQTVELDGKSSKCTDLTLSELKEVHDALLIVRRVLETKKNAQKDAKKSANKNGK
jgi:hypothetical protein